MGGVTPYSVSVENEDFRRQLVSVEHRLDIFIDKHKGHFLLWLIEWSVKQFTNSNAWLSVSFHQMISILL